MFGSQARLVANGTKASTRGRDGAASRGLCAQNTTLIDTELTSSGRGNAAESYRRGSNHKHGRRSSRRGVSGEIVATLDTATEDAVDETRCREFAQSCGAPGGRTGIVTIAIC